MVTWGPFSNTSRWVEGFGGPTTNKNLNRVGGDAGHDEFRELFRNVEETQGVPNVGPFYPIKGFFKVNLKDHIAQPTFHFPKVRDDFLDYDSMVTSSSFRQKTSLAFSDDIRKEGLESVGDDFGNDFVDSIAKSNGPEVFQAAGIFRLGNQASDWLPEGW